MFIIVREVRSWADYILDTERHLFRNMSLWDPRNNSDHCLILGCLRSATLREHENYIWRSTRHPLCNPTTVTKEDGLFVYLRRTILKPKSQGKNNNPWILADTWRIVDTKLLMRQYPARNQGLLQHLSRQIAEILKADWRRRVQTARGKYEELLTSDPPSIKKHGIRLSGGTSLWTAECPRPLDSVEFGSILVLGDNISHFVVVRKLRTSRNRN